MADDEDAERDEGEPEYEVGYKRPPRATRFSAQNQPRGRGRKKGSRGIRTELRSILNERVTVTDRDGKRRREPALRVMLRQMFRKAVEGDVRAGQALLDRIEKVLGIEDETNVRAELTHEDEQIVADFLRRRMADEAADEADAEPADPVGDDDAASDDEEPEAASGGEGGLSGDGGTCASGDEDPNAPEED